MFNYQWRRGTCGMGACYACVCHTKDDEQGTKSVKFVTRPVFQAKGGHLMSINVELPGLSLKIRSCLPAAVLGLVQNMINIMTSVN